MQSSTSHPESATTPWIDAARRRERVWPVFVAMLVAPVAAAVSVGISIGVAMLFGAGLRAGMDTHEMMARLGESFAGVLLVILPGQALFLGVAVAGVGSSAVPWRERLALRAPRTSAANSALLLAGTLGVTGLAVFLIPLLGEPSESMRDLGRLFGGTHGAQAVAVTLLASLVPALCEELLFRGYAQTRLVQRFGAWRGIAIASACFALAHFDPQHVAGVLPAAVWFGCVAWLARSTWMSIAAHASNNLAAFGLMHVLGEELELPRTWLTLGCVGALLALGAIGVLRATRARRPLPRTGVLPA